ncbi:MAG: ArsR/SmtB family transcription factor [Pyrinomonadaceae bacterium]
MKIKNEVPLGRLEAFFMALADKTRLRLLNLMGSEEICVCFFTDVLGDSQPKISRHLAYLRNAGLVKARRDGKWMHYSIVWPTEGEGGHVLRETLDLLADRDDLHRDREKYISVCCSSEPFVPIARTPSPYTYGEADIAMGKQIPVGAAHNELDEFLL